MRGQLMACAAAVLLIGAPAAIAHDGALHGAKKAAPGIAVSPPGGDTLPIPGLGGAFDLVDHTGAARSDKDFRGRLMLVMFGYTECPDVCGLELQAMASALATLGPDAAKVAPLFVTVDPETDTPATLAAFLAKFDPRIVGLTGTPAAIEAATRAYRVHAAKFRAPSGGDQVGHSAFIYLMGRDGGFLSMLLPNPAPEDIVARVQKYL